MRLGKVSKAYRQHIKTQKEAIALKRLHQGLPDIRGDAAGDDEIKSDKQVFISIDEAGSHVNRKYFR